MQNSKLITLLRTFSKKEMKDFEKFISSPYFSKGRNVKPLFRILKSYHPDYKSGSLSTEKLFRKIYPDKKFNDKTSMNVIRVMFSELSEYAEKFLAFEEIQKENKGFRIYRALSFEMLHRNLDEFAFKVVNNNEKRIKNSNYGREFFHEMIEINDMYATLDIHMNKQYKAFEYIHRAPLYIFGYLIWSIGILANDYITHKRKYNVDVHDMKLIESIISSFNPDMFERECYDDGAGTKNLVLLNYYIARSRLNSDDEESLSKAISIFKDNYDSFHFSVKLTFFGMLHNICIIRAQDKDLLKYASMGNELSTFAFSKGLYTGKNSLFLVPAAYTSFFHLKLVVLETNMLKHFIDDAIDLMDVSFREKLRNYSYACLYFKSGEFGKTLEYLSKFKSEETTLKNNSYRLKIAALFESGYTEETIYAIDSYEHYVKNNPKHSERLRDEGLAYINIVKSLTKIKEGSWNGEVKMLEQALAKNNNTLFGSWFRKKYEQLCSNIS